MLVLTRRKNQSIVIGDDIIVTVLEVKGDQIRLGITAPRDVQVYREELLAALKDANTSAVLGEGAPPVAPPVAPPAPPQAPSADVLHLRLPRAARVSRRRRAA
ncbi:MAG: carbon storage regulator CsrA [Actinomycetota bacterium]|nr:carbon storage regulator CsrA [Actinomycetota bacterium]